MKNTDIDNSSTAITEKEHNPEWNIIPLSPIISPERENKFDNKNHELNSLSDFESEDEIELSGTNNKNNKSGSDNDNDNEYVINRISETNMNNFEEEKEAKTKSKQSSGLEFENYNFEDEFEQESNNEKEKEEEEEEEEEVLFEVNSNSCDNSERDMSLFTKLSPRRQDLINTANRNVLFLYVQYDKVKKVEKLFKNNKIQIESLDESRNDLTLMQLAVKNVLILLFLFLFRNLQI